MISDKAFMSWSGGKDSALALYKAKQNGVAVEALVTSVNATHNRVSMHGVRRELLEAQAAAIGLPLYTIELPEMPDMKMYENTIRQLHYHLAANGFTQAVFGDIFLEDLRAYRETLLREDGLQCVFPLWKHNTAALMKEFTGKGFKAVVACVNSNALNEGFCGRLLDESFAAALPAAVDTCGENGEYHSFVFEGPVFSKPIAFKKGEMVFKEHPAPVADDFFTAPKLKAGFWFQDLLPA